MDWYHGSPLPLTVLRAGSTITQDRELARIFSHKPDTVCIGDDGHILHTGRLPGFLHRIVEPILPNDLLPHPASTMSDGLEWLTLRNFTLALMEKTIPFPAERLTDAVLAEFRARMETNSTSAFSTSTSSSSSILKMQDSEKCNNPVLTYATKNPAKLVSMRETLRGLPLDLLDLSGPRAHVWETPEDGETPMENAMEKAMGYWRQLCIPVFSIDSGLYFTGVQKKDQPGVHIRRMHGHRMDDAEMVLHYAGLARKYGGYLEARYRNAFCLVLDDMHCIRYEGPDIDSEAFHLVDRPHAVAIPNATAEQSEMKDTEDRTNLGVINGFRGLFTRIMPLLRQYAPSHR